jgi:hypothetical protein
MTATAEPSGPQFDLGPMETVGSKSTKATGTVPRPSRPKPSPGAAWTAWQTEQTAAARDEFLPNVTSWSQGTAAQLLRPAWPSDSSRPTVTDVEERLQHHLGVAAAGPESTYLDALELARRAVASELRAARLKPTP